MSARTDREGKGIDHMKRKARSFGGAILAAGLLWGAGGCGRPSGSFAPYGAAIAEARPADMEKAVSLMEGVANAAHFQIESRQTLPAGTIFFASSEELLLVMGADAVAGRIHIHVTAMAPKLNQSPARRKVLTDLDNALRSAFGDRLALES
jgi:hypothetical protein